MASIFPSAAATGGQDRAIPGQLYDYGGHAYNVAHPKFGAVGDGVTDDTDAFQAALARARLYPRPVVVPYGKYKISEELDTYGVDLIGLGSGTTAPDYTDQYRYPIMLPQSGFARLFKVGGDSDSSIVDRSKLCGFHVDFSGAQTGFIGIGSDFGFGYKYIDNFELRGVAGQERTKDFYGIKFYMTAGNNQIGYYSHLSNIKYYYLDNGLHFESIAANGNGWRQNIIDNNICFDCVKSLTILQSDYNTFNQFGLNSWLADFDSSAFAEWGIKCLGEENIFNQVVLEGTSTDNRPYIFTKVNNTFRDIRLLDERGGSQATTYYDVIHVLDNSGVRTGPEHYPGVAQGGGKRITGKSFAAPQIQPNLIINPNFIFWPLGDDFNPLANGVEGPLGWKAVDPGAGTVRVTKNTTATQLMNYGVSATLTVGGTPAAGAVYGIIQNLADYHNVESLRHLLDITFAVIVKPDSGSGTVPMYLKIDDGVATTERDQDIALDGSVGKIRQTSGEFTCIVARHEMGHNPTKLEVTIGIKGAAKTVYLDTAMVYQGTWDAWSAKALIEHPSMDAVRSGHMMIGGKRHFFGTAAPTVGTWDRGDVVWNIEPSSGGPLYWACTTAGTPGTWKAGANLA